VGTVATIMSSATLGTSASGGVLPRPITMPGATKSVTITAVYTSATPRRR
jgi:hypothetical protein